jgi:hypothetical protein
MSNDNLVKELEYWLRVIGDRLGADRRFNETINDVIAIIGAPAQSSWECIGRKQSLPEPGECNWPDCGCDPHATKVIESLVEQGWTPPAAQCAPQPSGEKVARDTERFSKFAPEPLAVIPEGTKMVLDTRTTLERINDRDAAPPAVSCAAREAIARTISPTKWDLIDEVRRKGAHNYADNLAEETLAIADAILSLPAAGGEASKREALIAAQAELKEHNSEYQHRTPQSIFDQISAALKD